MNERAETCLTIEQPCDDTTRGQCNTPNCQTDPHDNNHNSTRQPQRGDYSDINCGEDDGVNEHGEACLSEEEIRDAAASELEAEEDWQAISGNRHDNNTTTTTTIHNLAQGITHDANCKWDCHQSSQVDCRFQFLLHGQSSKRPCNCLSSSGLSAVLTPAQLVSHQHEWAPRGEETREVMSPREESPAAKLGLVPRPLWQIADATCHYSTHERVRAHLLACPSTGTSASGYIPGHSRALAYPLLTNG